MRGRLLLPAITAALLGFALVQAPAGGQEVKGQVKIGLHKVNLDLLPVLHELLRTRSVTRTGWSYQAIPVKLTRSDVTWRRGKRTSSGATI